VPEPSAFDFGMAIEKLKRHKSPGINKRPADFCFKQWEEHFALRSIDLLILFGIRRHCLKNGRSRSLYLFMRRVIKQIVVIIEAYHFCQLQNFIQCAAVKVNSVCRGYYWESSMWIAKQQVKYRSHILHSSNI
jgi:hypothetical protein